MLAALLNRQYPMYTVRSAKAFFHLRTLFDQLFRLVKQVLFRYLVEFVTFGTLSRVGPRARQSQQHQRRQSNRKPSHHSSPFSPLSGQRVMNATPQSSLTVNFG